MKGWLRVKSRDLTRDFSRRSLHFLPYPNNKRKQVTYHPYLRKRCFRLDLAYSTSIPSLEQKHPSCWKIFKSRHKDIALMSMYMTEKFCAFMRNIIFKSCFLLSVYSRFSSRLQGHVSQHTSPRFVIPLSSRRHLFHALFTHLISNLSYVHLYSREWTHRTQTRERVDNEHPEKVGHCSWSKDLEWW